MVILQLGSPPVVSGARPNPIVPGGIPIQSVLWAGQSTPIAGSSGQAHPAQVHEVTLFASGQDVNQTSLVRLVATGQMIPTAKLSFLSNSPAESLGFQMVLSEVLLSSVNINGNDVHFTLNFKSAEKRVMMKL